MQAHIQVTEPSYLELYNSTTGPTTRPRRRTFDLHSQVDQLPPTASVTRDSICSPLRKTDHLGKVGKYGADHL